MVYTWDIVIRLRPQMFVALMAVLILALPSQFLELYLIDIEALTVTDATTAQRALASYSMILAMLGGVGTMIILCLSCVHLMTSPPSWQQLSFVRRVFAVCVMSLVSTAPVLGVLGGLANVWSQMAQIAPEGGIGASGAQHLRGAVLTYGAVSLGLALATLAVVATSLALRGERMAALAAGVYSPTGVGVGLVLIAGLAALFTLSPASVPQALGTQLIVYLFLVALTFVLTLFSDLYRKTGWPITVIVVAAGLLFSSFGLTDNREIDYKPVARPAGIEQRFVDWLGARKDLDHYRAMNKPYPVYFVAAEGGGIYAGYHVASLLARLQDRCPNFAQHVFGISSVSGGSLGGAVFASLAGRLAKNGEWQGCTGDSSEFQSATAAYFSNDFLAPLVAATLFPDALQRILPVPVPAFSRAHAIERAFVDGWNQQSDPRIHGAVNPFLRSVDSTWSPEGAEPALFLNTTGVTSGGRVTLGPIYFSTTPTAVHVSDNLCSRHPKGADLPLVSAVSLSARFPVLTPAGWLDVSKTWEKDCDLGLGRRNRAIESATKRIYLADGGYFENSGIETIADLVKRLRAFLAQNPGALPMPVEIRIIMATTLDDWAQRFWSDYPDMTAGGPGELMTPITTLLATRSARTRSAQAREGAFDAAMNKLGSEPSAGRRSGGAPPAAGRRSGAGECDRLAVSPDIHMIELDGTVFFLPLGWRLSKLAASHISAADKDCRNEQINKIIAELTARVSP